MIEFGVGFIYAATVPRIILKNPGVSMRLGLDFGKVLPTFLGNPGKVIRYTKVTTQPLPNLNVTHCDVTFAVLKS